MSEESERRSTLLERSRSAAMKEGIVDIDEDKVKLVIFTLSGDYYALYGNDVKEILQSVTVFFVPGSPDYIEGIINLRGDIESVISISGFLGVRKQERTSKSRIAVAEKNGIRSGIIMDSVVDVLDMPLSSIKPPLSSMEKAQKDLVSGEAVYNSKVVAIIDLGGIFARLKT